MSVREQFVEYVENNLNVEEMPEDIKNYWLAFKTVEEVDKPTFTEHGKMIMEFLQSHYDIDTGFKARDIADGLFVSSRVISGYMRKLVADGYVDKVNQNPVSYVLTNKGKNCEII